MFAIASSNVIQIADETVRWSELCRNVRIGVERVGEGGQRWKRGKREKDDSVHEH